MNFGSSREADMALETCKDRDLSVVIGLVAYLVRELCRELERVLVGLVGLELPALFLNVVPLLTQRRKMVFAKLARFLVVLRV